VGNVEAVEVVLVSGILIGFIIFLFTLIPQQTELYAVAQPALMNLAQQALDRVILAQGDIATRHANKWIIVDLALSAQRPLYQPQIDSAKLGALAAPEAQGPTCTIQQQKLVEESGVSQGVLVGYGVLAPRQSYTYDNASILKNFFGPSWDKYDMTLVLKPLVNLTICPNYPVGSVTIKRNDPMCARANVPSGNVWITSTANGTVVVTVVYCPAGEECQIASTKDYFRDRIEVELGGSGHVSNKVYYYYSDITEMLAPYLQDVPQGAGVAVFAQKVDYPRAFDFWLFNVSNRPLVYGFYTPDGRVWITHEATVSCGSGNIPALGIRRLDAYTGAGFTNLAHDAVLNPGHGQGQVKVDRCDKCEDTARCAACYVMPPPGSLFIVVWVERNSQGGNAPEGTMVIIPLAPTPPKAPVRVDTWRRWRNLQSPPQTQSAVATRVVDSQAATYLVELTLYKWP